jgi:hypothetical protein
MRITAVLVVMLAVALPLSVFSQTDSLKPTTSKKVRTTKSGKTSAGLLGGKTSPLAPRTGKTGSQSTGQTSTQTGTPTQTPAVKFVNLQLGPEYITTTGYDLYLINTADSAVTDAVLQCFKAKDGNMTGSAPAGGQAVTIPAHDSLRVQVTHPAGWANGYSDFMAMVQRGSDIIGKRGWSIPTSAWTTGQ